MTHLSRSLRSASCAFALSAMMSACDDGSAPKRDAAVDPVLDDERGRGPRMDEDAAADERDAESTPERDADVIDKDAGDTDATLSGDPCIDHAPRALAPTAAAHELARLRSPAAVNTRGLGPVLPFATPLWTFSSTGLVAGRSVPGAAPDNFPSSAGGGPNDLWSAPTNSVSQRVALDEHLASDGVPVPLLTRAAAEQMPNVFVALDLTAGLVDGSRALGYVRRAAGFFAPFSEVWTASVPADGSGTELGAAPLFRAPEPLFGLAALRHEGYTYTLSCRPINANDPNAEPESPCFIARVREGYEDVHDEYRVFQRASDGSPRWLTDLSAGSAIFQGYPDGVSFSYNAYLGKFLVAHSAVLDNKIVLQAALAPEGPYEESVIVDLPAPSVWVDLGAREQPAFAQGCGQRVIVSFLSPTTLTSGLPSAGEVVLAAIDL